MMRDVPLRMPKMSMTMTDGELVGWHVEAGHQVSAGQVLCDVMTDKVDMEVESPVDGTVARVVADPGDVVAVGEPIAWISTEADDLLEGLMDPTSDDRGTDRTADRPTVEPAAARTGQDDPRSTGGDDNRGNDNRGDGDRGRHPVRALPAARRRAGELGVELGAVSGSGPDGAVTMADVEAAAPTTPAAAASPAAAAPASSLASAPTSPPAVPAAAPAPRPERTDDPRKAAVRRVVAERMARSATVPQFTVWRDLDLETVAPRRRQLSWTTVLLRAHAAALRDHPTLNAIWPPDAGDTGTAAPADQVRLSLAVDSPVGLLVPTITDPDLTDAADCDQLVRAVVERARAGRVDQRHLVAGTATLSNLGGLGVERFQALVTPPQVSVLALGAIAPVLVAARGGVLPRLRVTAGLTVDHRAEDGAEAARMLATLQRVLDDPQRLLGQLA